MKIFLLNLFWLSIITYSPAAVTFTEDFNSGTIGSNFIITDNTLDAGQPVFSGNNATFGGGGDAGRAYIGTVMDDFGTVSFTSSVDVTIQGGGGSNAFFGLGNGEVGNGSPGAPSFGEPSSGPAAYITLNSNNRNSGIPAFGDFDSAATGGATGSPPGTVISAGTHTIFLDYDATTGLLSYSADIGQTGTVVAVGTVDGSDNGFASGNSHIFFGGDDNTVFDNFSVTVIPEVNGVVFLLLAVVGMFGLVRKRRTCTTG